MLGRDASHRRHSQPHLQACLGKASASCRSRGCWRSAEMIRELASSNREQGQSSGVQMWRGRLHDASGLWSPPATDQSDAIAQLD